MPGFSLTKFLFQIWGLIAVAIFNFFVFQGWLPLSKDILTSTMLTVFNVLIIGVWFLSVFVHKRISRPTSYKDAWESFSHALAKMETRDGAADGNAVPLDWVEMSRVSEEVHGTRGKMMWRIIAHGSPTSYVGKTDARMKGPESVIYLGKDITMLKPKIISPMTEAEREVAKIPIMQRAPKKKSEEIKIKRKIEGKPELEYKS